MTCRGPVPHLWTEDPGGVVTRCNDVHTARALLVDAYLDRQGYGAAETILGHYGADEGRAILAEASARFRPHRAVVGFGRVIPIQDPSSDASWFWRPVAQRGPGVTPAVWWRP